MSVPSAICLATIAATCLYLGKVAAASVGPRPLLTLVSRCIRHAPLRSLVAVVIRIAAGLTFSAERTTTALATHDRLVWAGGKGSRRRQAVCAAGVRPAEVILGYQLASSSVTVGAFLASVLRQSRRLRFWSWPITKIGARPRSPAMRVTHVWLMRSRV